MSLKNHLLEPTEQQTYTVKYSSNQKKKIIIMLAIERSHSDSEEL